MAVSSKGHMYVADANSGTILTLSPSGRVLRTLSINEGELRRFRSPVSVTTTAGDTVRVFDSALWVIAVYAPDDSLPRRIEVPPAKQNFGQRHEGTFGFDGALFYLAYDEFQLSLTEELGARREGRARGLLYIEKWSLGERRWSRALQVRGAEVDVDLNVGTLHDVERAARTLWTVDSLGTIWTADTESGDVFRRGADGTVCVAMRLAGGTSHPASPDSGMTESYPDPASSGADRTAASRGNWPGTGQLGAQAAVTSIVEDTDGGVLVDVRTVGIEGVVWSWLNATGELIDRIALPNGFVPGVVRQGVVYGLSQHSTGRQRVEAFKILADQRRP